MRYAPKNKKHILSRHTAIAIAVASGMQTLPTFAEDVSFLEEVVVSARRTEESLQSVPVSVTAISSVDLQRKGISTLEDIQLATPGVHLSGSGGRSNPVYQIRGQSKALSGAMSPAVVTYFGEVPEPNYGSFIPQYDLGSVQVLKGPQGTLFGRNTTGGAILYSPVAPEMNEFTGHVSATVGNYNLKKTDIAVNIPLIDDKLAARLALLKTDRDGYAKVIQSPDYNMDGTGDFNGKEKEDDDTEAYRLSILFEPTDYISNTFIYDHMERHTNGDAMVPTDYVPGGYLSNLLGIDAAVQQQVAAQNARGVRRVAETRDTFEDVEKMFINNRTEIDFGSFELINIFGYRDVELYYLANSDGLGTLVTDGTGPGLPVAGVPLEFIGGSLRQELEQISNEIQLRGSLFEDSVDWLFGGYYLKAEPTGPQGTWVAFAAPLGTDGRDTAYNIQTEESKAVFTNWTVRLDDIAEGLEVEVGLRYTEDEIEACTAIGVDATITVTESDCKTGAANVATSSTNSAKSSQTTYSVGVNWQMTDDLFAYAVTRKGYRAGGINSPTFTGRLTAFQSFDPETVTDYEIGFRGDWDIGGVAVRTNISAFLGVYEDVQAPISGVTTSPGCDASLYPVGQVPAGISPDGFCTSSDDPSGNTLLINMGESEVSGVDLEVTIAPSDNLSIHIGANYMDAKTNEINRPDALAPYMAYLDEVRFEYLAQKTATASVNYGIPISSDLLENINIHADYYWTDDISFAGAWMIPSYNVTNFRVDFEGVATEGLNLGLWVRNVFDKDYVSAGAVAGSTYGFNTGIFAPPRTVGAEVRYNF